jgi:hypothetical protein
MEGVTMAGTATSIKYQFLGFVIVAFGIASMAYAVSWTVPGDFPNIQAAIIGSNNGDFITVDGDTVNPIVYSGPGFYNVDFVGKEVTVQSQWGPTGTIIDCQNLGRAFIFQSGETAKSVLRGFTIINGYAEDLNWPQDPDDDPSGYGGAIYIYDSTPTIQFCDINDCTADAGGGEIFCNEYADANISYCNIGAGAGSYNYAGWGFYRYIDINDVNDVNQLDVNDLNHLGGGIYCRNSSPVITWCNIEWNTAAGSGGGIACEESDALIRGCYVFENDARIYDDRVDQHGGGIYIKDCKGRGPVIEGCIASSNNASWSGGGIAVVDSNALINGCGIFNNNCWASAGGIYSEGHPNPDSNSTPNCEIDNCVIINNSGYWSGGVSSTYNSYINFTNSTLVHNNVPPYTYLAGGLEVYYATADVNGLIIWGNLGQQIIQGAGSASAMGSGGAEMGGFSGNSTALNVTYSDVQMFNSEGFFDPTIIWPGEGNINLDPLFVDVRHGDFHLKADGWDLSPCINTGDPFADCSLEPAPNGGRINMGAYGGTEEATSSALVRPVPADADEDLAVNMVDFAILADNWHLEGANIKNKKADLDNNNIIDEHDLFILSKFWLWYEICRNDSSVISTNYSDVQGGWWGGEGNIDANPWFANVYGLDNINGTEDDNLRLQSRSPCIDAGDPRYVPEANEMDLGGRPRMSLEGQIRPVQFWIDEEKQVITTRFSREEIQAILNTGEIELAVSIQLMDGTVFEGRDKIRVVQKSGGKLGMIKTGKHRQK